jgi:hypothetical protein
MLKKDERKLIPPISHSKYNAAFAICAAVYNLRCSLKTQKNLITLALAARAGIGRRQQSPLQPCWPSIPLEGAASSAP